MVNGQIDEPLAEEGIAQANAAISTIPSSITHIYHSPLLRATQTATLLNTQLQRPLIVQNELREIHMGSKVGKSWEELDPSLELKKKHRELKYDYRPHGGESFEEVKTRVVDFLKTLDGKHADNEVLLVTHGGIIRLLQWLEQGELVNETEKHVSIMTLDVSKMLKV